MDIRNFFQRKDTKPITASEGSKKTAAVKSGPKSTKAPSTENPEDADVAPLPRTSKYFGRDDVNNAPKRRKGRAVIESDDEGTEEAKEERTPVSEVRNQSDQKSTERVRASVKRPRLVTEEAPEVDPNVFFGDSKKIKRSTKPRSASKPVVKPSTESTSPKGTGVTSGELQEHEELVEVKQTQSSDQAKNDQKNRKRTPTKPPAKRRPSDNDEEDTEVDEDHAGPARKKRAGADNSLKNDPQPGKRRMPWDKEVRQNGEGSTAEKSPAKSAPSAPSPLKTETAKEIETKIENGDVEAPAKKKFNYAQYKQKQTAGPRAPGSKEVPEGAENCLLGMAFVFTGELTSISRDDAASLVKRHGGRVTGAPSSKTSYVVVGEEPGESKLKKAKELKLQTLDEDGLFELIRTLPGKTSAAVTTPKSKGKGKGKAANDITDRPQAVARVTPRKSASAELWTDKYKPENYKQVIGNTTLIQKLASWLKNWDSYRANDFKRKGGDEASCFRAVLLSGPPGLGKTTSAHLVSRIEGYDVLEFNASDTRSKKALDTVFRECTGSHAVTEFFSSSENGSTNSNGKKTGGLRTGKRQVLVMDEVDGMSGGDRGGTAELIQLIKKTKVPIICICNDRQSPKIKSLANYCFDLRFRRPTAAQVEARIRDIAESEGLILKPNVIAELVAMTSADIRQILNILSTYRLSNNIMTYDQSKQMAKGWEKNSAMTPFDVTAKLFSASVTTSSTISDRIELYFQDFSLIPLMVQENYAKTSPAIARHLHGNNNKLVDFETLSCIAQASDSISLGDLVDNVQRSTQNWSLMPVHAVMSTVRPCFFTHGSLGGQVQFAGWLGQNSKYSKNIRLLREIQTHMRLHISGNKSEVRLNYMPTLAPSLAKPLINDGADAIDAVIKTMDEYYLTREDWDTVMELGVGPNAASKMSNKIPASVKSSFTRTYNKTTHPTPLLITTVSKARKPAPGPVPDLEDVVEVDEVDAADDDEVDDEDDIAGDKLIKQKVARTSSAKGKGKASGSGRKR
ncbi:replication factor C subunit 1 [Spizellomyces punctatus DAOM BR117]|uniref:Replication factor C subunit 1 n=1 Tax=Spizellomyces punctatus (strain DAOM BR117) TaxID=645134 RepID=A0A0L0HA68_SPIPD|nr:replication factor C subunit 1 [Spizellomyces punctatus DAOM BR117]KNC98455.1 hypothetical protein SPPG_09353 [Spizellomyces punctatus DAOM BR117]|eukprot:XP_016606495.1 hypothetical protein SPPG_09353 [Spizellomyces punctatus DAOM BR117]